MTPFLIALVVVLAAALVVLGGAPDPLLAARATRG